MSTTMAGEEVEVEEEKEVLRRYLGLSFSLLVALLPENALSLVPKLQSQVRDLSERLFHAEEQLKQMKSRRKEDSKANARVVEIFASHRNAWQAEEKRLLQQMDAASEEVASLRAKFEELEREREDWQGRVQDLERDVGEREEMIGFMSRASIVDEEERFSYQHQRQHQHQHQHQRQHPQEEASSAYQQQDVQYDSLQPLYHMKHFVARRESPWKVDGDSTGVSSKLKLLEEELLNLEKVAKTNLPKVPSLMRKQTKRYQALAEKIDDLCRRMQASDPCEPTPSPDFRTQRQTEFLLEAFRLQQRASETGQKLVALQTDIGKSCYGNELGSQAKLNMRRCFDSIRNNLKEVQRNLEIWLARIIGDLEGILSRDGASRAREYYISRYPFVQ